MAGTSKKEESETEKFGKMLEKLGKTIRTRKVTTGALASACIGGMLKLTAVTQTFPQPMDMFGNILIFFAVLFFVADIAKGGLED